MCRLFGLTAGRERVPATFWLLGAPDSLVAQSQRNPDGTGLGTFDSHGAPVQERQPVAAQHDRAFFEEAKDRRSSTFVGHVRYKTSGASELRNCHPFLFDHRFFAHNGMVAGIAELEDRLGEDRDRVVGGTDSERCAALIARAIHRQHGDVTAGITEATRWIAEHVPVYALNLVITAEHELWALRYPDTHSLLFLDRRVPCQRALRHDDSRGISLSAESLASTPSVVVASEAMDDDPSWQSLRSGELLHVRPDLSIDRRVILPDQPARRITEADLEAHQVDAQRQD